MNTLFRESVFSVRSISRTLLYLLPIATIVFVVLNSAFSSANSDGIVTAPYLLLYACTIVAGWYFTVRKKFMSVNTGMIGKKLRVSFGQDRVVFENRDDDNKVTLKKENILKVIERKSFIFFSIKKSRFQYTIPKKFLRSAQKKMILDLY